MSDINKTNSSAEGAETEKKPAEKKTAARKTSEKKAAEKKTTEKKAAAKKTADKTAAEKNTAKKSSAKKAAKKEEPVKKKVNEKLIEQLAKWEKDPSRANLNAVMEEIVMTGKFLVPASSAELTEEEAKNVGSENGKKMRFITFSNAKGEKYFPAFTSPEQLQLWNKDYKGEAAVLTFDDLCSVVGWNPSMLGFVVDPFGANLSIGGELCGQLKQKKDALREKYTQLVMKNMKR